MRTTCVATLFVMLLAAVCDGALGSGAAKMPDVEKIELDGDYVGHLQDVCWDGGTNLWWAHTHQIVRTDMEGRILAKVDVEGHNAGIEVRGGHLYVAVCPMQNKTAGKTTPECHPQINVHDAVTLRLLERHILDGVIDRTGFRGDCPRAFRGVTEDGCSV